MAGFDSLLSVINAAEDRKLRKAAQILDMAKVAVSEHSHRLDVLTQQKMQKEGQLMQLNEKLMNLGIKNENVSKTIHNNLVSEAVDLKSDLNSINENIGSTMGRITDINAGAQTLIANYKTYADTDYGDKSFSERSRINGSGELRIAGRDTGLNNADLKAAISLAGKSQQQLLYKEFMGEAQLANEEERLSLSRSQNQIARNNQAVKEFEIVSRSALDQNSRIQTNLAAVTGFKPSKYWNLTKKGKVVLDSNRNNSLNIITSLDKELGTQLASMISSYKPGVEKDEKNDTFSLQRVDDSRAALAIPNMAIQLYKDRISKKYTAEQFATLSNELARITGISTDKMLEAGERMQNNIDLTSNPGNLTDLVKRIRDYGADNKSLGEYPDFSETSKEGDKKVSLLPDNIDLTEPDNAYDVIFNAKMLDRNSLQVGYDANLAGGKTHEAGIFNEANKLKDGGFRLFKLAKQTKEQYEGKLETISKKIESNKTDLTVSKAKKEEAIDLKKRLDSRLKKLNDLIENADKTDYNDAIKANPFLWGKM